MQRLACLSVTPTAALELLISLEPLAIFVRRAARSIVARLYRAGSDVGHAGILADLKRDFREVEMPSDHVEAVFRFDEAFDVILPDRKEWIGKTPVVGDVVVYTDGLQKEEGAGIYYEELRLEISIPLGMYATVFQS